MKISKIQEPKITKKEPNLEPKSECMPLLYTTLPDYQLSVGQA
jgi:hypothetical protein